MLDLFDERYQGGIVVMTYQLPIYGIASSDAILDRLAHKAEFIELTGQLVRKGYMCAGSATGDKSETAI